jgi:hypothetical protein
MADEMEVINPDTGGRKFMVDADNKVVDNHECIFAGDHSKGLDVDDVCTICGKLMGDYIVEGHNPIIVEKSEEVDDGIIT